MKFNKVTKNQKPKKKNNDIRKKHSRNGAVSDVSDNLHRNSKLSASSSNIFSDTNYCTENTFQWLLNPMNIEDFMSGHWEKSPLYIDSPKNRFSFLISTPEISELLAANKLEYTKNIDVTLYQNKVKELLNLEGKAKPHVVWDNYCNGCSIRLLNPQTFVPHVAKLASDLQDRFGCFVGCNAYLTPPNSQGFAPHYDDIEAFILQIEGCKAWKVYEPLPNESLPRYSSKNLDEEEIGDPILNTVLKEGDLLYLPRGYIHQAATVDGYHSLHITVSVYQKNSWIDFLEKAVPHALNNAWKHDSNFRAGLPLNLLNCAGLNKSENERLQRIELKRTVRLLMKRLIKHIDIDSTVDQMGVRLMQDALPPVILSEEEKTCTVFRGGLKMTNNGFVLGHDTFVFDEHIKIRLLRKYVCRLSKEHVETRGKVNIIRYRLYYTTDNSLEYQGVDPSFLRVKGIHLSSLQYLIGSYPRYVSFDEIPSGGMKRKQKLALIVDLWENGIIRTETPFSF